jgi:hypothetical protein
MLPKSRHLIGVGRAYCACTSGLDPSLDSASARAHVVEGVRGFVKGAITSIASDARLLSLAGARVWVSAVWMEYEPFRSSTERLTTPVRTDSKGNLWAGVPTGCWPRSPALRSFRVPRSPDGIRVLSESPDGKLLVGGQFGLMRLVNGRFGPYSRPS